MKNIIILVLAAIIAIMLTVALLGGPTAIKRQDCENQCRRMYGPASALYNEEALAACIEYCWEADY